MIIRCGFVAGVLMALTACGSSSVGSWDGECEATNNGEAVDYDLKIEIDEEKGGEVEGDAKVSIGDYEDDGDIEGDVNGKDIEWTFEISDSYGDYEVNLEGSFDDSDTLKGDCEVRQTEGGDFLAKGDFKLRRD